MLRHNLLITLRSFKKNKNSFLINILGLSSGMACAILIFMWVSDELAFDKFHENEERLYQVMQNINANKEDILTWEWTPGILSKSLKEEMPEIDQAIQVAKLDRKGVIGVDEQRLKAKEMFVGADFFDMFSFPLIAGRTKEGLSNKKAIFISDELAEKLFESPQNAVDQMIRWDRNWENVSGEYQVAGIFEKPPVNSSLQFDVLFSYDLYLENRPDALEWFNSDPLTYITLNAGTNVDQFNDKIRDFLATKQESSESTIFARKYSGQYLYGTYENGKQAGGRINYVQLFSLIALFVLVIACINFMNLSTARSARRAKEIGVKKSMGATRRSLVFQYLLESSVIVFIALFIALFFVVLAIEPFNSITGKALSVQPQMSFILGSLGVAAVTAFIAGSYPAFYLSGFRPVNILKGTFTKSIGELFARKGLVVFQFALSVLLIIAVSVIYKQLQFVHSKNLGYSKDNVIVLQKDGQIRDSTETFLTELRKIQGVLNASTLDGDLTGSHGHTTSIRWKGYENPEDPIRIGVMIVGNDILNTLGMELIEGRDFRKDIGIERGKTIINEAAAKVMGFDNPIGQVIKHRRSEFEVIGVVKNFNYESLYNEVMPCMIKGGTYGNNIYTRIQKGTEAESLASIESLYSQFNPGMAFDFKFLDENYQELYASENKVATLSKYFAGLAILISCLGLFGLSAFTAERREKEISVRKVLGAPIKSIVYLLSKDFILLVLIAILVASPIAAYLMNSWLSSFAYTVEISWWPFVFAGLTVLLLAFGTISYQSIKSAFANPVDALRNE